MPVRLPQTSGAGRMPESLTVRPVPKDPQDLPVRRGRRETPARPAHREPPERRGLKAWQALRGTRVPKARRVRLAPVVRPARRGQRVRKALKGFPVPREARETPDRKVSGPAGPQGPQGNQGPQGATGPQGEPGHTPEAGVDYYTAEERSAFVSDVLDQFPGQKISNATKATSDANGRMISPVYNQFYSNLGAPSLFELAALAPEFGCKSDFLPKANVQYEISKDLGATWEPFEVSDNDHATLWGGTYQGQLAVPKFVDPADDTSNPIYFRMTLTPVAYVYINLLYMYASGQGGRYHIKYEKRKQSTQAWMTQYETPENSYNNLGWPGHDIIYHSAIPYSHYAGESYFDRLRITIYNIPDYRSNAAKYPTFVLYKAKLYGGYPLQDDVNGIKINGMDKTYEFPAAIKLGGTKLTEAQLKKLLALI